MSILTKPKQTSQDSEAAAVLLENGTLGQGEVSQLLDQGVKDALYERLAALHLNNISGQSASQDMNGVSRPKFSLALGVILASVVVTTVMAVGIFVFNSNRTGTSDLSPRLGAEIALFEGKVEYRKGAVVATANGATAGSSQPSGWLEATPGQTLNEGDSVRVLGDGRAVVNLDDGSAVRIAGNSEVKLASLDPQKVAVENVEGRIYTRVVKSEREFAVRAGDKEFLALGTAYQTYNTPTKKGVEVYQSDVKVKSGGQQVVKVAEGNKYFLIAPEGLEVNKLAQIDAEEALKDSFIKWNKEQDEKNDEFKDQLGILKIQPKPTEAVVEPKPAPAPEVKPQPAPAPAPAPAPKTGISLTGSQVSDGIKLKWSVSGVDVSQGFKVVQSTGSAPVYPGDSVQFLDGGKRETVVGAKDGKTYYFKVCRYTVSGCDNYSNAVKVTAPGKVAGSSTDGSVNVSSISLSNVSGTKVSWTVNGTVGMGYKVVSSKSTNPTFGAGGSHSAYVSDPNTKYAYITASEGAGTYYVRVCAYTGSGCVAYSNQVTVEVQ